METVQGKQERYDEMAEHTIRIPQRMVVNRYWLREGAKPLGFAISAYFRPLCVANILLLMAAGLFAFLSHGTSLSITLLVCAVGLTWLSFFFGSRSNGWYELDEDGIAQLLYSRTKPAELQISDGMNRQTFLQHKGGTSL